jgi:hypothetical protein
MAGLNTGSLRISGRTSGSADAPLEAKIPKDHPERQDAGVGCDTQHVNPERGVFLIHPRHKVDTILGKTQKKKYGVYGGASDEDADEIEQAISLVFLFTHSHRL